MYQESKGQTVWTWDVNGKWIEIEMKKKKSNNKIHSEQVVSTLVNCIEWASLESNHRNEKKIERNGEQRTNIKLDCWLLAGQHNLFTPLYFIVEAILSRSLSPSFFVVLSHSLPLCVCLMFGVGLFTKLQSLLEWICAPVHKILFHLENIFWLSMAKDCITLMMVGKVSFRFLIHAKY